MMFVFKKKYEELREERDYLERRNNGLWSDYLQLLKSHTELQHQYFKMCRESLSQNNNLFNKEDINKMLLLCHPDKHGGKKIAHDITQKLLAMRSR